MPCAVLQDTGNHSKLKALFCCGSEDPLETLSCTSRGGRCYNQGKLRQGHEDKLDKIVHDSKWGFIELQDGGHLNTHF